MKYKNQKPSFYYFKSSIFYLTNNQLIIIVSLFIEYLPIYSHVLIAILKLKTTSGTFNEKKTIIYYISPYNIYKDNIPYNSNSYQLICFMIILLLLIFFFYFVRCLSDAMIENKSNLYEIYKKTVVNFYELIFFRLILIFIIDFLMMEIILAIKLNVDSNAIGTGTKTENRSLIVFRQIVVVLFLLAVISYLLFHYNYYCVMSNIKYLQGKIGSFAYDKHFTCKYDSIMLLIKITITIEKSIFIIQDKTLSRRLLLFDLLSLIILSLFCLYLIYSLLYRRNRLLYYQITNATVFRFFLLIFTIVSLVLLLCFGYSKQYFFYLFNLVSLLLFIVFFFEQFKRHIHAIFSTSDDSIGLLTFLISNTTDTQYLIQQWIIHHKVVCNNNTCDYCDELRLKTNELNIEKDELLFEKFYYAIWNIISKKISSNEQTLNKHSEVYIDTLELVYHFLKKNHQRLNFSILFYRKMRKYSEANPSFAFNLMIIFEMVKELNIDFIKSFLTFQQSSAIILEYKTMFNSLDNFFKFEIKSQDNILKIANHLHLFENNQQVIDKLTVNISSYSYQLLILRFLYETMSNRPLKKTNEEYDINDFLDYIDYHYANDTFIIISYDIISQECKVVQSCGHLKQFTNGPFEDLFPQYIRVNGNAEFIKLINENNFNDNKNVFSCVIQNANDENNIFVEEFQLKFVMFPSMDDGEVLISGQALKKENEIMIFIKINKREYLISFSEGLMPYVCITPEIIEAFFLNQKLIYKDVLLKKSPIIESDSPVSSTKCANFEINSSAYYVLVKNYFEELSNSPNIDKDKILKQLYQNKNNKSNRILRLEKLKSIKGTNTDKYIIYKVTIKTLETNNNMNYTTLRLLSPMRKFKKDSIFLKANIEYNDSVLGNDLKTVSNSSDKQLNSNNIFQIKRNEEKKGKRNKSSKTYKVLIFYSTINVLILIFTLIELVVQLKVNSNFFQIFDIYQAFSFFRWEHDLHLLRITSNLCIVSSLDQPTKCDKYFENYSMYFLDKYPGLQQYNILMSDYILLELNMTYHQIKSYFLSFYQLLYSFSQGNEGNLFQSDIDLILINIMNNDNVLSTHRLSFYEGIRIYINYIAQAVNQPSIRNAPISFFDYDSDIKNNRLMIGRIDLHQKMLYEIIINYPNIVKGLNEVTNLIVDQYKRNQRIVSLMFMGFTLMMIILNIIHCGIGIYGRIVCNELINESMIGISSKLRSKEFRDYFLLKLEHMKTLIELYNEIPSKLIKAMINKDEEQKKQQIQKIKANIQDYNSNIDSNSKLTNDDLKGFINKKIHGHNSFKHLYLKHSICVYLIIFTFNILLFYVLIVNNELIDNSLFVAYYNSELSNYLYNNINVLQFMLIANVTGEKVSELIDNNDTYSYIESSIEKYLYAVKSIDTLRVTTSNEILDLTGDPFNCSVIEQWTDVTIQYINNLTGNNYYPYIMYQCTLFPILAEDLNIILTNMIYLEQKLINTYLKMSYNEKIDTLKQGLIWELYSNVLIYGRIIIEANNYLIIPQSIQLWFSEFKANTYGVLITNIALELILISLLYYLNLFLLIKTNKKIMAFLLFLEGTK